MLSHLGAISAIVQERLRGLSTPGWGDSGPESRLAMRPCREGKRVELMLGSGKIGVWSSRPIVTSTASGRGTLADPFRQQRGGCATHVCGL